MTDTAFEARYAKSLRRRRRIKVVGFALLALLGVAFVAGLVVPFVIMARESARERRIMRLEYPDPPSAPGVYAVSTKQLAWNQGTALVTPPMPVQFDRPATTPSAPPISFEVVDGLKGTTRVGPVPFVQMIFKSTPQTWPVHHGRMLTIDADGTMISLLHEGEYQGEGWGLDKQDLLSFAIPLEFFVHTAKAKQVTAALDGRSFTIMPDQQAALRDFAAYLKPGIKVEPPK